MFLIVAFRKSFRNVMLVLFLELFGLKKKFEIRFEIFFKGDFEIIPFILFY
jgi:hypothetical protein